MKALSPPRALLGAIATSAFGDGFRYAALPLVVAEHGGSATTLGSLLATGTLPFLLVGLIGGALVDRVDRVRLLQLLDLIRFAAAAAFAAQLALGVGDVVVSAFIIAFVMGCGEAFALPGFFAVIPRVVPAANLAVFNGRSAGLQTIGRELLGPVAGASIVASAAAGPFALDALTFACSWLLLFWLRSHEAAEVREAAQQPGSLLHDVRDAIGWMSKQPVLLVMAGAAALINLGNMGFLATQAVFVTDELRASPSLYGVMMGSTAIGGSFVALGVVRWRPSIVSLKSLPWACASLAAAMTLIGTAPSIAVAIVGGIWCGGSFALYVVTSSTVRQQLVPDVWRGRSEALYRMISWGVLPIGSFLGGLSADGFGLRAPALITAGAALAAGTLLTVVLLRLPTSNQQNTTGDTPQPDIAESADDSSPRA